MTRILANRSALRALVLVGCVVGALAWFGAEDWWARRQAWQGNVTRIYRERRWSRGVKRPLSEGEYRYYNHYWDVQTSAGSTLRVRVPWHLWQLAKVGDPVAKRLETRWPEIDTPEARAQSEVKARALGVLFGEK